MSEPTPRIDYFTNGSIKAQGEEKDGQLHGAWTWYRQDGTVKRTGFFEEGKQVGKWITYTPDGQPYKETDFLVP